MNEKTTQPAGKGEARRRLLRGTFAAPAVMTLSSGSALAASSALVCASKLPETVTDSDIPGNYFQVQRYTATKAGSPPETRLLVKGGDINTVASNQGFAAGSYGSFTWINVSDGSDATAWVGTEITPTAESGKAVALRFENTGTESAPVFTVSGLSDAAQPGVGTGKVMSASCWNSFK